MKWKEGTRGLGWGTERKAGRRDRKNSGTIERRKDGERNMGRKQGNNRN